MGEAAVLEALQPAGGVRVGKQWLEVDGRRFLVEEVPVDAVAEELESLPQTTTPIAKAKPVSTAQLISSLPVLPEQGQQADSRSKPMQLASVGAVSLPGSALVLDYVVLNGTQTGIVFKGDTTYHITGIVYLGGTNIIEGGTVIKFSETDDAGIWALTHPVICKTGPYRPAILTSENDDTVGEVIWEKSTGVPTPNGGPRCNSFLVTRSTTLEYLRVKYACQGVFFCDPSGAQEIRHCQFLDCESGVNSAGGDLFVRNTLFARCAMAIRFPEVSGGGPYIEFRLYASHLTVDGGCLVQYPDYAMPENISLFVNNCIFANVTRLAGTYGNFDVETEADWVDISHNGFYNSVEFGENRILEIQWPFAPTCFTDEFGNEYIYIANGQGAYYLREGSVFVDAGTPNIDPVLKKELARMTTVVPELFFEDVNSSMTLSPTPIRDTDKPDLGYHYPAVDYVVNGATVNNATLSIDQGTALAYVGTWCEWGVRLNPGGRLIVNGVPTNRVVFAPLEAVQEGLPSDISWLSDYFKAWGPLFTFKGIALWHYSDDPEPSSYCNLITPFPEAKLRYTDLTTVAGGLNVHFGNIYYFQDPTYCLVANLELDGCNLQGGAFLYDDGGPEGRTLTLRNTIFERTRIQCVDTGFFYWAFGLPEFGSRITAVNNLFYHCAIGLCPVTGGDWSFTDNIFDNVRFIEVDGYVYNGPVGINHHNAYVNMTDRLSPTAPTSTDPNLASLSYQTGPLGQFYLPTTATALIDKGSRLAADAGLYHFTSFTSNVKEGNEMPSPKQVNIGPHYLALAAGKPVDSNNDGVADFLADRNGNGIEDADEMPWLSPNSGPLAILSPANGSTVNGIIKLGVSFGANAKRIDAVWPLVDGGAARAVPEIVRPADSIAEVEIDTRYLQNGEHVFSLVAYSETADEPLKLTFSQPISLIIANDVRYPSWENKGGLAIDISMEAHSSLANYTLFFFDTSYPVNYYPCPTVSQGGTAVDGIITYSQAASELGYSPGDTAYIVVTLSDGTAERAVITPAISLEPAYYPALGRWVAAYADNVADYNYHPDPALGEPIADVRSYNLNPVTWSEMGFWMHDAKLNYGWRWLGCFATAGESPSDMQLPDPYNPDSPQTWPVRMFPGNITHYRQDRLKLMEFLSNPDARNFVGYSHGSPNRFFDWNADAYARRIRHRYRFVFLDGCHTASAVSPLLQAFGATIRELLWPVYPPGDVDPRWTPDSAFYETHRPAAFMGWKTKSRSVRGPLDEPVVDPRTGRSPCYFTVYEAMCNWHVMFIFLWAIHGETLLQAIEHANWAAMTPSSNPQPDWSLTVPLIQSDGQTVIVPFDPYTCLRVYGYGNLRFNEYNHCGDWPGDICMY